MGDELRDADWSSGDIHRIAAVYESIVEEVMFV
jgi:hypothetical protein